MENYSKSSWKIAKRIFVKALEEFLDKFQKESFEEYQEKILKECLEKCL